MKSFKYAAVAVAMGLVPNLAQAGTVAWVDWQNIVNDQTGTTITGQITVGSQVIDVTYFNPTGVAFLNDGVGAEIDYWQNNRSGRDPSTSAYTSTGANGVDNIPTGTDLVAMRYSGMQTLSFSQEVSDLYFSYVSTNGNTYQFDHDFTILSNTRSNYDGNGIDDGGYWGSGTVSKTSGVTYDLVTDSGEPHGTVLFGGALTSLMWNSLINENWNGFTVGLSVASNTPEVPIPAAIWLFGTALGGGALLRRKKKTA